jgi:hypothetical protein
VLITNAATFASFPTRKSTLPLAKVLNSCQPVQQLASVNHRADIKYPVIITTSCKINFNNIYTFRSLVLFDLFQKTLRTPPMPGLLIVVTFISCLGTSLLLAFLLSGSLTLLRFLGLSGALTLLSTLLYGHHMTGCLLRLSSACLSIPCSLGRVLFKPFI